MIIWGIIAIILGILLNIFSQKIAYNLFQSPAFQGFGGTHIRFGAAVLILGGITLIILNFTG